MQTPKIAQIFPDQKQYWQKLDAAKATAENDRYPSWAFDFLSVHGPCMIDDKPVGRYNIVSSMKIVEKDPDMRRPDFENESFGTKADAVKRAKELARQHNTFVVICG